MNSQFCKICGKELKLHYNSLSLHLKTHNIEPKIYYDLHIKEDGENKCKVCNEETSFINIMKGYNKTCCSKCGTLIQWQGEEGEKRKQKQSERFKIREFNPSVGRPKGSKNKNPYPMTKEHLYQLRYNNPQAWKGKKHSEDTKIKMSETRIDKIISGDIKVVGTYKGKFTPRNIGKYKGDYSNIVFRSSWEKSLMIWLDNNADVIKWNSEEVLIPYISKFDGTRHVYHVDFFILFKDGTKLLVEVKPKIQTREPRKTERKTKTRFLHEVKTYAINTSKWDAAKTQAEKHGATFVIWTEDELEKLGIRLITSKAFK